MAEEEQGKRRHIRIYQDIDIDEVKKHLMLIDDLYGSCANCKNLGLNFVKDRTCPQCNTTFEYLATRSPSETGKILARIRHENLPLKLIDRGDYDKASATDALGNLFK